MVDTLVRLVRSAAAGSVRTRPGYRRHSFRPRAAAVAWGIGLLAAGCGGLALFLRSLNRDDYAYWLADMVIAAIYPFVGALIVSHHPQHALGWVLCMVGLGSGFGRMADGYATYALTTRSGSLPGGEVAAWLGACAGGASYIGIPAIPLLFPDGRLPSRRWRPIALLWGGAYVVGLASFVFAPGPLNQHPTVVNPMGIEEARTILPLVLRVAMPVYGITALLCIVAPLVRFRMAQGVERAQIKWFAAAALFAALSFVGNSLFPGVAWLIGGIGATALPTAIGIAILRYRLWDIDLIINRTLVYGALSMTVAGIYVLVVGYLSVLFSRGAAGQDNPAIALVATGLVAVLFQPLRARLQHGVNRLMYGQRDDPYAVISALGRRLEATLASDAVLPAIVQTVAEALKLPYAAITLRQDGSFVVVASSGVPIAEPLSFPLGYQGETVGELLVAPRAPGETFGPADRRLLDDLARQAGSAVYAVRLTADLQHARERLVTAREEERRRLRRDLHDGLGPVLASQALTLDVACRLLERDPAMAGKLLQDLKVQAQEATADIRRLVYALRPPALDDLGLIAALRELASQYRHTGLHVTVEAPEQLPALPAAVEVAVYRIVQEALTNVVRHARARICRVRLFRRDTTLCLEVCDDGHGLPDGHRAGVGLNSMRERAAELGGSCTIETRPEGGTLVTARLPFGTTCTGEQAEA